MKTWWWVAVSLAAGSAFAQQPSSKFYVALDVGSSRLHARQSENFFGPEVTRQSGDDLGFKVLLGIQVSRYFGVEAGYTDFGSFTAAGIPYTCPQNSPPPCTFHVTASTRGPSTNLVGLWPFADRWALAFRAGLQYAQSSTTDRDPDIPGSGTRHDDSSWGALYGVGLNYQVSPRVRVRLNWERNNQLSFGLNLSGGAGVYELGSSSLTSLGLDWRF